MEDPSSPCHNCPVNDLSWFVPVPRTYVVPPSLALSSLSFSLSFSPTSSPPSFVAFLPPHIFAETLKRCGKRCLETSTGTVDWGVVCSGSLNIRNDRRRTTPFISCINAVVSTVSASLNHRFLLFLLPIINLTTKNNNKKDFTPQQLERKKAHKYITLSSSSHHDKLQNTTCDARRHGSLLFHVSTFHTLSFHFRLHSHLPRGPNWSLFLRWRFIFQ